MREWLHICWFYGTIISNYPSEVKYKLTKAYSYQDFSAQDWRLENDIFWGYAPDHTIAYENSNNLFENDKYFIV